MPVYRLTPLERSESSRNWQASLIKPYCLWIQASDEREARHKVALATANGKQPISRTLPWDDTALVSCTCDPDKDVAYGIIRVRMAPPPAADYAQSPNTEAELRA